MACPEVKCLPTEKAAEGWGLSGADVPPSPWPPAPSGSGTQAPRPLGGCRGGVGAGFAGPGPGASRRIPESPLTGPLSSWVLSLAPGQLMETPSVRGVPRGVATTLSGPSLSPLSLSPLLGAVPRGGGGVKGKQRAGKPMCSGAELCPQGTLAPSGGLAVTAQGHTTPCEQGGAISQKRPSLPPAGAQSSPGTTTQHTLSRQDFGPVPLQQTFRLRPQLLENSRGAQHPWRPVDAPDPGPCPSLGS